jgi:HEAT repeat protein
MRSMLSGAALILATAASVAAQSLERRISAAPDGEVRLTYAARPGVVGNGVNIISWDCESGRCKSQQVEGNYSSVDDDDWRSACDSGPVRVALQVRDDVVTGLKVYVGGAWRTADRVTDLGTVSAPEAARYFLALARQRPRVRQAVFAATLADSITLWPDLLRFAKDRDAPSEARKQAVFWLGQAAADAAGEGLDQLATDDTEDREVRKSAIFALSQRPREEGVPALIRIARASRDRELRRTAIFWLGQSEDPRALALFEELLTRP